MTFVHHARLVRSNLVKVEDVCGQLLNTDIEEFFFAKLGIDDARELIKKANIRPVSHDVMTLVVRAEFITHEAQNALLKILEEPPISTRFVLVVPEDLSLLSTLQSRLSEDVLEERSINTESENSFTDFLKADYKQRLSAIESAVKNKDLDWQRFIQQGLINHVRKSKRASHLYELEFVARNLLTRGASNKMLLEHLALTL